MQKKGGRFSADWIAQLKQSISLVDVASENVELRKTGNRYMGRCPFHGDRSPSFSVNKDFYYCFGCKETGDVISFVTKLHGLSFEEACEDLAEKAKLPIPEATISSEEERAIYLKRARLQKAARLNLFACIQYYYKNFIKGAESPLFQEARDYVKNRGITQQTIDNFQVGVAGAQHDGLVQFLTQAKAPLDIATEFGLIRPSQRQAGNYDFFRERVLFPLIDVRGRVCGFGGRILPSVAARPSEMKLPKYLNTAESELFQKSKFLYGLFQAKRAIRETETVIVVEGYFDVISLYQAGFENVVATCGTSLTEEHLKVLSRLAKKIIVFFDRDSAGINATTKAMEMGLRLGMMLYGIPYESELDFDEFLILDPVLHLEKMKGWVTQSFPLVDHLVEQELNAAGGDIEKRTQAIKQITGWLEAYTDPVGRSMRVDQLIQKYKIPVGALGSLGVQARQQLGQGQGQSRQMPRPHSLPIPIPRGHPTPGLAPGEGLNSNGPAGNQTPGSTNTAPVRRRPIGLPDRQLLQFLVKFNDFGSYFLEARKQMHEKDTLSVLFDDSEVQDWVQKMSEDPSGFSRLKLAPETLVADLISQELRSVIMEGLLQEVVEGEQEQLKILLRRGIHKSWARFSQRLKQEMSAVDPAQDTEKFRDLSQQFLDLQRKLKDFEDSYVSGKHTE